MGLVSVVSAGSLQQFFGVLVLGAASVELDDLVPVGSLEGRDMILRANSFGNSRIGEVDQPLSRPWRMGLYRGRIGRMQFSYFSPFLVPRTRGGASLWLRNEMRSFHWENAV